MASTAIVSSITVRISDGSTFKTSTTSAAEYLLDPCFLRFLVIAVMLYGVLYQRQDIVTLAPVEQLVLWLGMFFVTSTWLLVSVGLNLFLIRRRIVASVFTPFVIFPMVPINQFAAEHLANLMEATVWETFPENVGFMAQNLIIAVCYDILHGRYVAPTHPTYVPSEKRFAAQTAPRPDIANAQSVAPIGEPVAKASETLPPATELPLPAAAEAPESNTTRLVASAVTNRIEIAKNWVDTDDIFYIKSEDHYLKLQLKEKSLLLRGKLGSTISKIDSGLGIQINRSVWLAFKAIDHVGEAENGNLEVTLYDGTAFRVANSRKLIFMQSLRTNS